MRTAHGAALAKQPGDNEIATRESCDGVVARSAAMREVLNLAGKAALTDVSVLIQGEPGVGKATVAREIHRRSRHSAGPFVYVAIRALRESEIDETLFGEPSGGIPAEERRRASLVESSRQGTLYLDEVARLPMWAQVRLLDVLQQGASRGRGGEGSSDLAGPRVISAATVDLAAAVAQGSVHGGLYYYLGVMRIDIPPLRHRQEDVLALGKHFLAVAASMRRSADDAPSRFTDEAWQALLGYDWPGNALQLAGVVARALMLADGPEISRERVMEILGPAVRRPRSETFSIELAGGLKEMELAIIDEVLRRCRGNKAAAARSLRLHRRTLYRLLESRGQVAATAVE